MKLSLNDLDDYMHDEEYGEGYNEEEVVDDVEFEEEEL